MEYEKKRGRPKKNDIRDIHTSIRLNDEEMKMLVYLMEKRKLSGSEALRYALKFTFDVIS